MNNTEIRAFFAMQDELMACCTKLYKAWDRADDMLREVPKDRADREELVKIKEAIVKLCDAYCTATDLVHDRFMANAEEYFGVKK